MKKLFSFSVPKEIEVTKEETVVENGESIKKIKTVKEQVPVQYFIKKPTRTDFDENELYHGVKLAEGIKEGMLTKSMLVKRFSNDGGILSDPQKNRYTELYLQLAQKENEFQRLILQDATEKTKETRENLENELVKIRNEIQDFELTQSAIFEQTAENRARNKSIFWWILFLSYTMDGEREMPIFDGATIKEKLDSYDKIMEDDQSSHLHAVIQKFVYLLTMWYVGQAATQKDFELLFKNLEVQEKNAT